MERDWLALWTLQHDLRVLGDAFAAAHRGALAALRRHDYAAVADALQLERSILEERSQRLALATAADRAVHPARIPAEAPCPERTFAPIDPTAVPTRASNSVARVRALRARFNEAHLVGMDALHRKDYAALGRAIRQEEVIVSEQSAVTQQHRVELERERQRLALTRLKYK